MVGMQLESDAKSDAVIENNGTINIYASNSYAFSQLGSNGHIVNNGTVYIDDNVTGSGFIKQDGKTIEGSGENGDGTEEHYAIDGVDCTEVAAPTTENPNATMIQLTIAIKDGNIPAPNGGIAVYKLNNIGGLAAQKLYTKAGFCDEVVATVEKQD